jgi:hypothetical protein
MSTGARRGGLVAVVVVAAAVGGVFGNKITDRWDGFAIGFLVVTVLGSVAAIWLDRAALPAPDPARPAGIVVGDVQGVYQGNDGVQINYFGPADDGSGTGEPKQVDEGTQ